MALVLDGQVSDLSRIYWLCKPIIFVVKHPKICQWPSQYKKYKSIMKIQLL